MLYRMYKRFAERRGYKISITEEQTADFGIKLVEMNIEGPFAYGYLSGEKGACLTPSKYLMSHCDTPCDNLLFCMNRNSSFSAYFTI